MANSLGGRGEERKGEGKGKKKTKQKQNKNKTKTKQKTIPRTTGTTSHPQNKRVRRRSSLRLKEPIKQFSSIGLIHNNLTGVLGERRRLSKAREGVEFVGSFVGVDGGEGQDGQHKESANHFSLSPKKKKEKRKKKTRKKKKERKKKEEKKESSPFATGRFFLNTSKNI